MIEQIRNGIRDIVYVAMKEMKATFKDMGMLIFFVIVPLAYPMLYSWIYNNQVVRDVPVVVVDMCNSGNSRKFVRQYDASPDVKVAYRCTNLEEARRMVGRQKACGVVYIPETFDADINRGKQTTISIYCDMSIMLHYKAIYQTATAVVGKMNSKIQIAGSNSVTRRDEELTTHPLDFDEVAIFAPSGGYGDFIIPAALILILHQTLLLGIGMSAGTARENDPQGRLIPRDKHYHGMLRVVLGKSSAYFVIYVLMSAFTLLAVPKLFGWIQILHAKELIMVTVPFLLSTIFFGLTMSCLVRYRENVMLIVVFTTVPLLFLSGVSWPESAMPAAWRSLAYLFPSTFGIRAFVGINTLGATLDEIQKEYLALWCQVLVYFFTACAVYKVQTKIAEKRG